MEFGRVAHSIPCQSQKVDSRLPDSDYHRMYVCCPSRVCLTFSLLCLTRVVRTPPRSLHVSLGLPALSLQSQLELSCVFIQRVPFSLDARPLNVFSHRAHTDPARSPQTMRTSPTLPCLFTPSTSTPTTCLPPSLTLPRILSPVAPRSVLSFVFSLLLTSLLVLWLPFTLLFPLTFPLQWRYSSL